MPLMAISPFEEFLSNLDFGTITGPTPEEDARDLFEQRDRINFITALLASGALRTLDGSTSAQKAAWRAGADFAADELEQRCESDFDEQGEPLYVMTGAQLYVVLVKAICAAYRGIDASAVDLSAEAALELFTRMGDAESDETWQPRMQILAVTKKILVRLAMQAGYIYGYLNPDAVTR